MGVVMYVPRKFDKCEGGDMRGKNYELLKLE